MATSPNLYAVKVGGKVEIRRGKLKRIVSKLTRTVEVEEERYVPALFPSYGQCVLEVVPKKVTLKQEHYTGGRIVATCSTHKFRAICGPDVFVALTKAGFYSFNSGTLKKLFSDPKWRKRSL